MQSEKCKLFVIDDIAVIGYSINSPIRKNVEKTSYELDKLCSLFSEDKNRERFKGGNGNETCRKGNRSGRSSDALQGGIRNDSL